MIAVRICRKKIFFPNRQLIAQVKEQMLIKDALTFRRMRRIAHRFQTPEAKVYQQLVREGLI